MAGRPIPTTISTKTQRIAELARQMPGVGIRSLSKHIDVEFLREAYRRTRKDGAPGVDGVLAGEYAEDLDENLRSLLDRMKSGTYRASCVRRKHIPKGDGSKTRPIGIPTFEDKVLQRAVVMVMEPVYEQDFRDCSFGFRPRRSAHRALQAVRDTIMDFKGGWVLDADIRSFFDTLDHSILKDFLAERIQDGVIRRTVHKWLKAGVMEAGRLERPTSGTPQGGVISPLLANIYLHNVLDTWFEDTAKQYLRGRARLIRFADDFVIVFSREDDARKIMDVLPKRFGKYGLELHPEKTRLVEFNRPPWKGKPPRRPETFDFLGFTHHWGRSRRGNWVVKQKTSSSRLTRALHAIAVWCRENRHRRVRRQHPALARKLQGHYAYYGITGNYPALHQFFEQVKRRWRKWLNRRSQRNRMDWERFALLLGRYPLPRPRIVHSYLRL